MKQAFLGIRPTFHLPHIYSKNFKYLIHYSQHESFLILTPPSLFLNIKVYNQLYTQASIVNINKNFECLVKINVDEVVAFFLL